jgi:ribosomal protein S27AE
LAYRTTTEPPVGTGELVTYRTYREPVEAQLARARLASEGIEAHVLDEGPQNVIMTGAVNGIRLQVSDGDLARVEEILGERPWERERDDGEGPGAVRCPRCELAYCFHERLNVEGNSGAAALSFFTGPLTLLLPKRLAEVLMARWPERWHCHKCGHVWDDPRRGPAEMTPLAPDDPRPVFRLRRAHPGMGVFLGLFGGMLAAGGAAAALPKDLGPLVGAIVFVAGPFLGWLVGRSLRYDVCSAPACRAPLVADRETCPRCAGEIAGVIRSAEEHYAAAARFRRQLAGLRAKDAARTTTKKKKAAAKATPALRR